MSVDIPYLIFNNLYCIYIYLWGFIDCHTSAEWCPTGHRFSSNRVHRSAAEVSSIPTSQGFGMGGCPTGHRFSSNRVHRSAAEVCPVTAKSVSCRIPAHTHALTCRYYAIRARGVLQNLQNIVKIIRHDVGLHPGAAAKYLIISLRYRLLRGAALHHAAVNISFATPPYKFVCIFRSFTTCGGVMPWGSGWPWGSG